MNNLFVCCAHPVFASNDSAGSDAGVFVHEKSVGPRQVLECAASFGQALRALAADVELGNDGPAWHSGVAETDGRPENLS